MPDIAEVRRLNAAGIALLVLSGLGFAWLGHHAEAQWPPAVDQLAAFFVGVAVSVNLLVAGVLVVAAGCGASRPWHDPRRRLGGVVCFGADGAPHAVPVSMWPPWGRDIPRGFGNPSVPGVSSR